MPARAVIELAAMPIAHMIRRLSDAFTFSAVLISDSTIFSVNLASSAAMSAFVAICSRAPSNRLSRSGSVILSRVSIAMRIFSHAMKSLAPKRALWRLVALAGDAPSG